MRSSLEKECSHASLRAIDPSKRRYIANISWQKRSPHNGLEALQNAVFALCDETTEDVGPNQQRVGQLDGCEVCLESSRATT
ncbi:hypothetical protein PCPL58_3694 [Pseudomonas cerasi]|uniref:Uncharacterized protein n=1 Tax=Pseudomonas cerasi TaxID=1583341 RepID=A0A193SSZ3_9PSED|nr:hypothetical protein PCPL58_3694 [Pseudomonas cerasi]SOS21871.1 hypothetical protein PL963_03784 [Pseudomonas cerasi]